MKSILVKNSSSLIVLLLLLLLSLFSCNEDENNDDNNKKDLKQNVTDKFEFLDKFVDVCNVENLNKNYKIKTNLKNLRDNVFFSYWDYRLLAIDDKQDRKGLTNRNQFYLSKIYEYSLDATDEPYGYAVLKNNLVLYVSKDNVYFMTWRNKNDSDRSIDTTIDNIHNNLINKTTYSVFSNLDSSVISRNFNFESAYNEFLIDSIYLELYYNPNSRKFDFGSKIYSDSVSFFKYLKENNKNPSNW